jgi:hypothetical protein
MKVVYLIQTHKNPEQIYRLVEIIKKSSFGSYILVAHNYNACNLDVKPLHWFPEVEVINTKGGRGNFYLVQGYLDAIGWLLKHNVEFDWLINITGQDYPTQPLPKIEKFLDETKFDGFLEYFNAVSPLKDNPWGFTEGYERYFYRYWQLGRELSRWQRALIKLPRKVINTVQPFVRINTSYGLMVGIRSQTTPFNENFLCYGGSYFMTLSKKCIQYLHEFVNHNIELKKYYEKTRIPDESFLVSILVNSGIFNFCHNDNKRYIDWDRTKFGHPHILTAKDYPKLIDDDIHFARKFDITQDSKILDLLDRRIFQN